MVHRSSVVCQKLQRKSNKNAVHYQAYTVPHFVLLQVHSSLSYIHISSWIVHTHTHTHTYNIYCHGISIRLWALVSCSYCEAEGLNETIIRTLKCRGPQMIRKSEREKNLNRKRGWGWKSPAIEPIHHSALLLRDYFSPEVNMFGVFDRVCACVSVSSNMGNVMTCSDGKGLQIHP